MIVLIINGAPRVGKNTFIKLLDELVNPFVEAYSSIDWVKDLARDVFDWDGTKDAKSRKMLSDLKDIATAWDDIPFREVCKQIKAVKNIYKHCYFCTNIREPQEIQKLKGWCKQQEIPCYSVWIRQEKAEQEAAQSFTSSGDTQYQNYNYDFVIHNDLSLDDFKTEIRKLIYSIKEIA